LPSTAGGKAKSISSHLFDGAEKQFGKLHSTFLLCSLHINEAIVTIVFFFLPRTLNTALRVNTLVPDQGKQKQQSVEKSVLGTGRSCPWMYLGIHYSR